LLEAVEGLLTPATLSGLRVLVTAGGTREPIDSVRYIGNRSSGAMGIALAAEAARRGAEVELVAANVALPVPRAIRMSEVATAAEMKAACEQRFDTCDVLLMAAAVADFRPAAPANTKLKKNAGPPALELEATDDVLQNLTSRRTSQQTLVGFAAEHGGQAVEYGRQKLERKRLDAVVVNDISTAGIGFDASDNEVTILAGDGRQRHVARTSKRAVAAAILDEVERIRASREEHGEAGGADGRTVAGI
jgi:phosphopantothenoylcysteine decarboxylase/phosphopantothenate--cysteine ligase